MLTPNLWTVLLAVVVALSFNNFITEQRRKIQMWEDYPVLLMLDLTLDLKYNVSYSLAEKTVFEKTNPEMYLSYLPQVVAFLSPGEPVSPQ